MLLQHTGGSVTVLLTSEVLMPRQTRDDAVGQRFKLLACLPLLNVCHIPLAGLDDQKQHM